MNPQRRAHPVNFDGRMECLPARIIQATHTLLYSASIQAMRKESPGFYLMDSQEDKWIEIHALSELRNG